jgi:hypothetical protein
MQRDDARLDASRAQYLLKSVRPRGREQDHAVDAVISP